MKIAGIYSSHDCSFAVLEEGIPIVHAELERYIRVKEPKGDGFKFLTQEYPDYKDIKYFSEYVKNKTNTTNHPLIQICVTMICEQLIKDLYNIENGGSVSLAGRWCPREKGRFSWLFKKVAIEMFPEYIRSSEITYDNGSRTRAYRKANTMLRKRLSTLNTYLDTTQVKMCGGG